MSAADWTFESACVVLPRENVDTDQIIPARFLTTTQREGLGPSAFADWRYTVDGAPDSDFPLNAPAAAGARVLVTGHNFGCGSSREHAVWALQGAGFRAVVSSAFADIFRSNALGNGLLPIKVAPEVLATLIAAGSGARVRVALETATLGLPDGRAIPFPVPAFAQHCLLHGVDELGFLLAADPDVGAYESRRPPGIDTRAIHPASA